MIFPAPTQGREPAYPENLVRTQDATFLYFPGAKVVAYFHGNGEDLADSVPMVSLLRSLGMGVLAVEYPGYGIAGGTPSEQGAYAAAQSALDWLRAESGVDAGRVVLLGKHAHPERAQQRDHGNGIGEILAIAVEVRDHFRALEVKERRIPRADEIFRISRFPALRGRGEDHGGLRASSGDRQRENGEGGECERQATPHPTSP